MLRQAAILFFLFSCCLPAIADTVFSEFDGGSRNQAVSTTMVFARLLRNLVRDERVGKLPKRTLELVLSGIDVMLGR